MKMPSGSSNVNRRNAIGKIALIGGGMGLMTQAMAAMSADSPLPPAGFYLPPKPPLQPGPGGIDVRTWVRSSQTNMQFSCVETAVAPRQMGPAPHMHAALDELMLVVEGTATVWVDGKTEEIEAGGWHFRPRQIEHTFWNGSNKPLRFIDMYFNQNFEDFLEELFHHIIADMIKNQLTPADPGIAKRMADLDKRFGVTMIHEKRQPLVEKYELRS